MKKILIFGHTGKVGTALLKAFPDAIGLNSKDFDALNYEHIGRFIEGYKPDIIFNCIPYQGIDKCEKNPDKAIIINSMFPKIERHCNLYKSFWLFIVKI